MSKSLRDILGFMYFEIKDEKKPPDEIIDQAEAEIKALMDEEELKDILFGQLVSHERYDDVFARLKISMEDARKLAKAIKQWWESQGKEEGDG